MERPEQYPPTQANGQALFPQHGCIEWVGARTCYELRYAGYSPVLRDTGDFFDPDDGDDGDCECACHVEEPDESTGYF